MRLTFKQRILTFFILIFVLYTIGIIYFEQKQGKEYRTQAIQERLDGYTELVHSYIENGRSVSDINPIVEAMPDKIRVTIVSNDGEVLFDNKKSVNAKLENHLERIEIKGALYQGYGTNMRKSASTNEEYLYYAKHFSTYFVRIALPYDVHTKSLLKADDYFIYTTIALFALVLLLLFFAVNRFNRSILDLKNLTRRVKRHEKLPSNMEFSHDELGDISKELVKIFDQKEESKKEIEGEREKLRKHFQYSEEGLAIFDSNFKKVYVNTHFIQFANILTSGPTLNVDTIFEEDAFREITSFIKNSSTEENVFTSRVERNGRVFSLKTAIFEDQSFELTIKDITKIEKNRILKQEITSNIAHELRTPVTALRGFLETISEQSLPPERQKDFVRKAYQQSIRLSDIIEDVSLLSKIEEQSASFEFEHIHVEDVVDNIKINYADKLLANNADIFSDINNSVAIRGNYNLLFSTFQNLVDNSLKYAGKGIEIHLNCYTEDSQFFYFSYYDTGKGVDEKYLNLLFKRFYRIDEGRDRSSGGSGLGLSIVKNIILLHRGDIQAKRHNGGGLEFLFKLPKQ